MIAIKLAYYREKDWMRFINIIDDRESMHNTWDDWYKAFVKTKKDLMAKGFEIIEIVVDIDELIEYCELRRIKNDGKARSQFVTNK